MPPFHRVLTARCARRRESVAENSIHTQEEPFSWLPLCFCFAYMHGPTPFPILRGRCRLVCSRQNQEKWQSSALPVQLNQELAGEELDA